VLFITPRILSDTGHLPEAEEALLKQRFLDANLNQPLPPSNAPPIETLIPPIETLIPPSAPLAPPSPVAPVIVPAPANAPAPAGAAQ